MSALFGNTTEIPGRISPGEFSLRSGQLGAMYGGIFNQAMQSSANRAMQTKQGEWPTREDGYDPRSDSGGGETEPWKFM